MTANVTGHDMSSSEEDLPDLPVRLQDLHRKDNNSSQTVQMPPSITLDSDEDSNMGSSIPCSKSTAKPQKSNLIELSDSDDSSRDSTSNIPLKERLGSIRPTMVSTKTQEKPSVMSGHLGVSNTTAKTGIKRTLSRKDFYSSGSEDETSVRIKVKSSHGNNDVCNRTDPVISERESDSIRSNSASVSSSLAYSQVQGYY